MKGREEARKKAEIEKNEPIFHRSLLLLNRKAAAAAAAFALFFFRASRSAPARPFFFFVSFDSRLNYQFRFVKEDRRGRMGCARAGFEVPNDSDDARSLAAATAAVDDDCFFFAPINVAFFSFLR